MSPASGWLMPRNEIASTLLMTRRLRTRSGSSVVSVPKSPASQRKRFASTTKSSSFLVPLHIGARHHRVLEQGCRDREILVVRDLEVERISPSSVQRLWILAHQVIRSMIAPHAESFSSTRSYPRSRW